MYLLPPRLETMYLLPTALEAAYPLPTTFEAICLNLKYRERQRSAFDGAWGIPSPTAALGEASVRPKLVPPIVIVVPAVAGELVLASDDTTGGLYEKIVMPAAVVAFQPLL